MPSGYTPLTCAAVGDTNAKAAATKPSEIFRTRMKVFLTENLKFADLLIKPSHWFGSALFRAELRGAETVVPASDVMTDSAIGDGQTRRNIAAKQTRQCAGDCSDPRS